MDFLRLNTSLTPKDRPVGRKCKLSHMAACFQAESFVPKITNSRVTAIFQWSLAGLGVVLKPVRTPLGMLVYDL